MIVLNENDRRIGTGGPGSPNHRASRSTTTGTGRHTVVHAGACGCAKPIRASATSWSRKAFANLRKFMPRMRARDAQATGFPATDPAWSAAMKYFVLLLALAAPALGVASAVGAPAPRAGGGAVPKRE